MSFINENTKEINCKIVYFGPALSGKSTSLRHIYNDANKGAGKGMVSIAQDNDRTLYFDFVPLSLGKIGGFTVRLHLYTIPGESGYQQSRALISKGVDGVVFVADSQLTRMEDNLKSLTALGEILRSEGLDLRSIPFTFAYNKRDLTKVVPAKEMSRYLNPNKREEFETVAIRGDGIMDAFRSVGVQVLRDLKENS